MSIFQRYQARYESAREEVMSLDDLEEEGSEKGLREKGRIHRSGHDYVVADGDVIHFICA